MTSAGRPNKSLTAALWANAVLLAVVVVALFNRGGSPSFLPAAYAQNQQPIAGGAGVFIMPGQIQEHIWGCYMLDVDSKTLSVYQYEPGIHKLRLAAARSYRYDTKLEQFNTEAPTPREVKVLVEKQQGAGAVTPDKDKDK